MPLNGRTEAQPLGPTTARMRREPTSGCQTLPSMNSWGNKPIIPRVAFCPLSRPAFTPRNHRITKPDFRPCSSCSSRQARIPLHSANDFQTDTENLWAPPSLPFRSDRSGLPVGATVSDGIHLSGLEAANTRVVSQRLFGRRPDLATPIAAVQALVQTLQ